MNPPPTFTSSNHVYGMSNNVLKYNQLNVLACVIEWRTLIYSCNTVTLLCIALETEGYIGRHTREKAIIMMKNSQKYLHVEETLILNTFLIKRNPL